MKNGWTTHSSNNAIWLALSPCHMTVTCKINKLEKPGGQLKNFHTLFGRSAAFYGHFRADTVTSEWSTRISSSAAITWEEEVFFRNSNLFGEGIVWNKGTYYRRSFFSKQILPHSIYYFRRATFWKKAYFLEKQYSSLSTF